MAFNRYSGFPPNDNVAKYDLLSSLFDISKYSLIYDLIYLDTFDNSSLLYKRRCPF